MLIILVIVCALAAADCGYIPDGAEPVTIYLANKGEFPYQVSIQILSDESSWNSYRHVCSGSIYSERLVITSADCIKRVQFHQEYLHRGVVVKAGVLNLHKHNYNEQTVAVESMHFHPGFTRSYSWKSNICVLKLKNALVFDDTVKPILLPSTFFSYGIATLSTWASNMRNATKSGFLQYAEIAILDSLTCNDFYRDEFENYRAIFVDDGEYCTRPLTGHGMTHYQGDSGDPLVQLNGQGKHELIGISTQKQIPYGLQIKNPPPIYTRVYAFIDFIKKLEH